MRVIERSRTGIQSIFEEISESESSFTDSSTLFSIYLSHAERHDKDQAEGWKEGANGILVFTGLFAAALATFIVDSYKSLFPNSTANTVVLLTQISHQLDGLANGTLSNKDSSSSLPQSNWQPPAPAVWVNVLWFLSLINAGLAGTSISPSPKAPNVPRPDKGLISRALGWTLDKMDEEGELVQFAAGIPGFSRFTELDDAVSILEEAPKYSESHSGLYHHITNPLILSAKPGLPPDSKLLPESVRKERIKICLEAWYLLPGAIKNVLRYVADKKDNKTVINALPPLLQSVESWRVAERLSTCNRRIHPEVTIAAQCVVAVLASQTPDEQTEPIVMQLLKIKIQHRGNYTALGCIEMEPEKYSIIISAVCSAKNDLNFEDAWPKLREKYETLLARIASFMTGSSLENARRHATELYSELAKSLPI